MHEAKKSKHHEAKTNKAINTKNDMKQKSNIYLFLFHMVFGVRLRFPTLAPHFNLFFK